MSADVHHLRPCRWRPLRLFERGELGKLELVGGRARKVLEVEEVCAHRRCHLLHMRSGTSLVKGGDGGEAIGMVRVRFKEGEGERLVIGGRETRYGCGNEPRSPCTRVGLVLVRERRRRALGSMAWRGWRWRIRAE